MNFKSLLTPFLIVCFAAANAQTADEVLEKYFKAIGGKDKWKAIKTMTTTQKMNVMGMDMPMTLYQKVPNKQKGVVKFQGAEMIQSFDGKQAWAINPMKGGNEPALLPVEQANSMADLTIGSVFIDYKTQGHAVTFIGTEVIDGIKCYKLELVKNKNNEKDDVTETHYFDAENYIPIMVKSQVMGQEASAYYSDYQEVNGLMFSFLQEVKMGGQTVSKFVVEKITLNDNLEDAFFAFPKK